MSDPVYPNANPPVASHNTLTNIWSAASVVAGNKSYQVCLPPNLDGLPKSYSIRYSFSGAPGTYVLEVQHADVDTDADYVTMQTSSSVVLNTSNAGRIEMTLIQTRWVRLFMSALANSVTVQADLVLA